MSIIKIVREALKSEGGLARAYEAEDMLSSWCDAQLPRVPGMDTVLRLVVRLANGRTVEEAAGREYAYRWNLALVSPRLFGVPHTLGM